MPPVVLDPCLLFPVFGETSEFGSRPYIAVYGHSLPSWFAAAIRSWAQKRGCKIVSIGYRNDWADQQLLSAGPLEFADWIANAAAVVTNFFHGCVFALVHAKPFACVASPYRLNKVQDLMNQLGASAHLVDERHHAGQLDRLLDQPLVPAISQNIVQLRERSNAYLDMLFA